jgi:hypothetical protein
MSKIYLNNATIKLEAGKGEHVTVVESAEVLAQLFTGSQLNKVSQEYLGKTFNKVAREKMAKAIFPVLEGKAAELFQKSGAEKKSAKKPTKAIETSVAESPALTLISDVAEANAVDTDAQVDEQVVPAAKAKTGKKYLLKVAPPIPENIKASPQVKDMVEIFSREAEANDGKVEKTREEIVDLLQKRGFISRNIWGVVLYWRGVLVDLGVMAR